MNGLLVVGAGGHGKVVADIARELGRWDRIAFLDDKFPEATSVSGWQIIGKIDEASRFLPDFHEAIVAIGANSLRIDMQKHLSEVGFQFPVLVHPDASVSRSVVIGEGTVICAQAAVIIDACIGRSSIVNTGASVGHDCLLGDGVHVAPGVRLAGGVSIGECCWIGIGAVVKECVSIGPGTIVGAGSTVIMDLPNHVLAVGSPARALKTLDAGCRPTRVLVDFVGFLTPEDPRWQEALLRTPHDFFHSPGYLGACAPHEGGDPLLFLLNLGEFGMIVPLIRRSLGEYGNQFSDFSDVSSPYGYPGPLYWGEGWQHRLAEMHAHFESFLCQEKVVSLFLRLNPFLGASNSQLSSLGTVVTHGPTVFIDLRNPDQSWKGINHQNRSFITRMIRDGYVVRIDQWDTMDQVIIAYHETMQRLKASPYYFFPKTYFQHLRDHTSDMFHLATAFTPAGDIMGGCFFSEVNGLIQYFLMGTRESFVEVSPSKLLIDALRRWGIEHGHHSLHLGGGVGARRDGLFEFKFRLSKSLANFSTFRKVLLPETYFALARSQGWENPDDEFFPVYRKPRVDPSELLPNRPTFLTVD